MLRDSCNGVVQGDVGLNVVGGDKLRIRGESGNEKAVLEVVFERSYLDMFLRLADERLEERPWDSARGVHSCQDSKIFGTLFSLIVNVRGR